MTKRFNRGFTLIELLVVIAIIGILSSVVLASLNTARGKGANAAVKSNLANMRAEGEIVYDNSGTGSYATACSDTTILNGIGGAKSAAGVTAATNVTLATAGSASTATCHSSAAGWAAEVPLKVSEGANTYWCVDSSGASTGTAGSTLGASDVTCN